MSDLISREEAVKEIRKCKIESDMPTYWYRGMETAQEIIEALPSATSQSLTKPNKTYEDDLISRQDAIDAMDKLWGDINRTNKRIAKGHEAVYLDMRGTIKSLPSADRPTGKWEPFDLTWGRNVYFCTACKESTEVPTVNGQPSYNYCPNCGAKMGGDSDG